MSHTSAWDFGRILNTFFYRNNCDDGTSAIETGHIFKEVAEKFLREHPNDFCDIRMIYAPIRSDFSMKLMTKTSMS